ncbi:MAG: ABC transporter ATP-binding protein [Clostridia bacterium]|nr:ABC transporter ATP-binding protein [Clostridia bacterium]
MKELKFDKKVKYTYTKEDKKKISMKEFKPLFKYYKKRLPLLISFLVLMIVFSASNVLIPIFSGNMIAAFTTNFNPDLILKYAILISAISLTSSLLANLGIDYIWQKANIYVRYDLNNDLMHRLNAVQISCYDSAHTNTFTSRMFSDVQTIASMPQRIIDYSVAILSKISFIFYTLAISWEVGVFMTLYVLVSIITRFIKSNIHYKNVRVMRKISEEQGNLQLENIRGMKDVRSLNTSENLTDKISDDNTYRSSLNFKFSNKVRAINGIITTISHLFDFGFIALCVALIFYGRIDIAVFMIVYNYRNSISNFANNIIHLKDYLNDCAVSAQRVNELFDNEKYPVETFGNTSLEKVRGHIQFKNVKFEYKKDVPVLKDISFEIKPNSIVSFVGKSGSGKTTISALLGKLYPLEKDGEHGQILIDGIDINQLTKDALRDNVCIVPQSPYMFNMTIAENLRLAKPNATDEELLEVLDQSQLLDFVNASENKLNSKIGENGIQLSGGQKQRLAIARSLLKNAKIIVFDEATSALDNENQAKIKNIMKNLSKDHTIIMIAHRLSTVIDSDNIIFIKDGVISAQGTHDELMQTCEDYKALYCEEENKKLATE